MSRPTFSNPHSSLPSLRQRRLPKQLPLLLLHIGSLLLRWLGEVVAAVVVVVAQQKRRFPRPTSTVLFSLGAALRHLRFAEGVSCVRACFSPRRLNHDTASYRGKFESENAVPAKVTTLSSMKKNGFISSATRAPSTMAAKAAASSAASASVSAPARSVHAAAPAAAVPYFNAHEARQLKKFDGGVAHGPSLIDMLQSAASGAAQASLKHTGTSVRAEKKALAGDQYTKFEL